MFHRRVLTLLLLALLIPFPLATSQSPPTSSGSFVLTFKADSGSSSYTIQYDYPKFLETGKTLNVTALLEVNELSNLKLYLIAYELQATIFLSNGHAFADRVLVSGSDRSKYLYAGSHWGPVSVTVPINDTAAGISPGGSVTGYVSLRLIADVWYDQPIGWHYPESDARDIGNVTITSSPPPLYEYLPYLVLTAAALIVIGVVLVMLRRHPKSVVS